MAQSIYRGSYYAVVMKMVEYQAKKVPVTYAGEDGLIDVVNFVPFLGLKDFRDKAVEQSIGDPVSWQRYHIGFPKQIKGRPEGHTIDGYL